MAEPDWRTLPKVELHCHLDGILDPAMAREVRAEDPLFPVDPERFEQFYPVDSYESFMRWWECIAPLEGDLDRFRPILRRHIQRLKRQGVVYLELMVGGSEIPQDLGEAREKLAEFREWLDREGEGVIQV